MQRKQKWLMSFIIASAGLGGILYGYDIGVISGALLFIQKTIALTDSQLSFVVGAVLTGSLLSTLVTGYIADHLGRRTVILFACIIFAIGIFSILAATSFLGLLLSRLSLGVAVGIISVAIPLYLAEIAPSSWRGRSVTVFQLFLTAGILIAYGVNIWFAPTGNWHAMFALLFIPVTCLFVAMLLLPETPRFLLSKGKNEKAKAIFYRLQSKEQSDYEMDLITQTLKKHAPSWKALIQNKQWIVLLLGLFVAACNQLTGINVFLQFSPIIFKKAGIHSDLHVLTGTLWLGAINFMVTIISLLLIDKLGRRKLILIGTAGIVLSELFIYAILSLPLEVTLQGICTLGGLLFFIMAFAFGPGVVIWLAISEIFPTRVRGKAVSLCLFINALCAASLSNLFVPLLAKIGLANVFLFFSLFSLSYFLVTYFFLPETQGKALEVIQVGIEK